MPPICVLAAVCFRYLHRLSVGEEVGFKHIKFNVKEQYPFEGKNTISMVCGGTGLTPMYQVGCSHVNRLLY